MAEAKKASLTVLGGRLAGTRTLLPDDAEVTIGSSEECSLCLEVPTVDAVHARLVTQGGTITVFTAGAERPLHVNDSPVGAAGAALRNGDILWLGTPGEDEVVMLQCILPRRPAAAPGAPPAESGPAAPTPEIETTALWTGPSPSETTGDEATAVTGDESTLAIPAEEHVEAGGEGPPGPGGESRSGDEPLFFDFGGEEDRGGDEAVVVEEPQSAPVVEEAPVDLGEGSAVVVEDDELFAGAAPTVITAPEDLAAPMVEATVAIEPEDEATPAPEAPPAAPPPPAPTAPSPSRPVAGARPAAPRPEAPAARPARPRREGPAAARPGPMPAPSASIARRRPTPRREAPEAAQVEPTEAPSGLTSRPALLAGGVFAAVLVVGALGWAVWRFVLATPAPSPTPVVVATPFLPPVASPRAPTPTPLEPVSGAGGLATPEPTAIPEPTPAVQATPTPLAASTPTPAPRATPTPSAAPTPTPPPPPPQPSADALRAQQTAERVQGLLAQADTAVVGRQYDAAIGHLDEALRLDPANAQARSARAAAVTRRDLAKRRFVGGRTRVQTEKDEGGGLAGFDTGDADLRKAPDFQGRIEFEMTPASGIEPGDAWTLRAFVVNEGKKPIRVQGVIVSTQANGTGTGAPVPPRTGEIAPQQRAFVAETSGTWAEGTTAWSTEVTVTANKGDSLRATLTWR